METPGKFNEAADRSQSNQSNNNNNHTDSKDEVDFVTVAKNHNNNNNNNNTNDKAHHEMSKPSSKSPKSVKTVTVSATAKSVKSPTASEKTSAKERISIFSFGKKSGQKAAAAAANDKVDAQESKPKTEEKPSKPAGELPVSIGTPPRVRKFVKSTSISRLLGNTYNAKKFEKEEKKRLAAYGKFNTYGGRRRANGPQLERFKRYSKEDGDEVVSHAGAITGSATLTTDARDSLGGTRVELVHVDRRLMTDRPDDLGAKAKRTISRGWGKLWWKRSHSVDISTPDPEFKVSYLGNVLTGWAKGEGCVEKQLNTLWRNYTQNNKPDVTMRIKVCASGLKATTRQHGLTEYWANRITHCCAPKNYPRVFCWIYRHEGRKLKHELRCHAVLCSKEKVVQDICNTLKENLESALREFKREKILRQNARLSLANAVYDNPSMPRRKILLSVGGNNYRPPLERSKSAPKLMAIEEAIGEEEGEEVEETNEPEMKACCQKDSLYPAMTLGRRRCHRGHSIRRTGKTRPTFDCSPQPTGECCHKTKEEVPEVATAPQLHDDDEALQHSSDDSDDFEKVLKHNNYDSTASLANELMPYFDLSLHKNTSCSLGSLDDLKQPYEEEEALSLQHTISGDPNAHAEDTEDEEDDLPGLRRNGICSDGEEDYLDGDEDLYFQQASILNMLHRNSMRKMAQLSLSSDEGNSLDTNSSSSQHLGSAAEGASAPLQYRHQMQSSISSNASSTVSAGAGPHHQHSPDSDEGSISSGCETASTVTANHDDLSSLSYRQSKQPQGMPSGADLRELMLLNGQFQSIEDQAPVSAEEIYQRLESRLQNRHNSDATTFSSSSSITLKMNNSPSVVSVNGGLELDDSDLAADGRSAGDHSSQLGQPDFSDSECSDESGYVEFQEKDKRARESVGGSSLRDSISASGVDKEKKPSALRIKPTPPPRPMPMPRRLLTVQANATTTV